MTRIIVTAPEGASSKLDWARQLVRMPEFHAPGLVSSDDALLAALHEQIAAGHHSIVVCAATLDKGTFSQYCQPAEISACRSSRF